MTFLWEMLDRNTVNANILTWNTINARILDRNTVNDKIFSWNSIIVQIRHNIFLKQKILTHFCCTEFPNNLWNLNTMRKIIWKLKLILTASFAITVEMKMEYCIYILTNWEYN